MHYWRTSILPEMNRRSEYTESCIFSTTGQYFLSVMPYSKRLSGNSFCSGGLLLPLSFRVLLLFPFESGGVCSFLNGGAIPISRCGDEPGGGSKRLSGDTSLCPRWLGGLTSPCFSAGGLASPPEGGAFISCPLVDRSPLASGPEVDSFPLSFPQTAERFPSPVAHRAGAIPFSSLEESPFSPFARAG